MPMQNKVMALACVELSLGISGVQARLCRFVIVSVRRGGDCVSLIGSSEVRADVPLPLDVLLGCEEGCSAKEARRDFALHGESASESEAACIASRVWRLL